MAHEKQVAKTTIADLYFS